MKGLMGLDPPGFTGVLKAPTGPVNVVNGVFAIKGKKFNVDDSGEVTDENEKPVAQVKQGVLTPIQNQNG